MVKRWAVAILNGCHLGYIADRKGQTNLVSGEEAAAIAVAPVENINTIVKIIK